MKCEDLCFSPMRYGVRYVGLLTAGMTDVDVSEILTKFMKFFSRDLKFGVWCVSSAPKL